MVHCFAFLKLSIPETVFSSSGEKDGKVHPILLEPSERVGSISGHFKLYPKYVFC
jgi:hypothetical protein